MGREKGKFGQGLIVTRLHLSGTFLSFPTAVHILMSRNCSTWCRSLLL